MNRFNIFVGILLLAVVCLTYGLADLNRDMSATRAELAQARQDAARNSVELVKAQGEARRAADRVDAVYSQVKNLRMIVEGER